MGLNPLDLDAITREVRTCFLHEDAPDYLLLLEQGLEQLQTADPTEQAKVYTSLMRAAHSLKGGAGIAQLPELSQMAHRLEDLLEALQRDRIRDQPTAHELLSLGIAQINDLVAAAREGRGVATLAELPVFIALEEFLQALPQAIPLVPRAPGPQSHPQVIQAALETDLEACLQRLEQTLQTAPSNLAPGLQGLVEECTLLGQMLGLNWLLEVAGQISQALALPDLPLNQLAIAAVAELRQQRDRTLADLSPLPATLTEPAPATPPTEAAPEADFHLRIPLTRLDRINNTVGELLITHERLSLYQSQLQQASLMLKKWAQQFDPIQAQVQNFYDRLATPLASLLAAHSDPDPSARTQERSSTLPLDAPRSPGLEFDPLQLDRYTELHTTLQDFQELMLRVQENREDLEVLNRDLQEALDQLRQHLTDLRADLTHSRLIPFRQLAEKFAPALQTLARRQGKAVELSIVGADTLIDQAILEQLKTPLTHLIRNAFDHGIESSASRIALEKPATGRIQLSATLQGTQLSIAIADDGRGMDLEQIFQQGVKRGLFTPDQRSRLRRSQILDLLFLPGFSTAGHVTSLSGRGVGLDVVRLQVERLRGSVEIDTAPGQGTTFTLKLPLTLSILPLLLFQSQRQVLAMPSVEVQEIISLAEFYRPEMARNQIFWQNQAVPLYSLRQLLPYRRSPQLAPAPPLSEKLGIVVQINHQPCAVAVDALLGERELVVKPFDATIPVPAYVIGCTVLGTGQVVPVLSPQHLAELIPQQTESSWAEIAPPEKSTPETPAVLIADDSIAVRRLLRQVLLDAGYQVVSCRDGQEALEELQQAQGNFDLVISDIEMPRLDGYGLLQQIRTHSHWHHLPVLMLTSRASDRHRQKALSLGATAYFAKPFQAIELLTTIAALKR